MGDKLHEDLDRLAGAPAVTRRLVPGVADPASLSDPGVDGMREETDAELRARSYEPPVVTPIGNFNDLLRGGCCGG